MTDIIADSEQWQALNLRLVGFPLKSSSLQTNELWRAVTEEEIQEFSKKGPEEQSSLQIEDSELKLYLNPVQFRWEQSRLIDVFPAAGDSFPSLGDIGAALSKFTQFLAPWLNSQPSITRLGFGAILGIPVESHQEGYEVLDRFLHDVNLSPDAQDFHYRINRRRTSQVISDLEVNRLNAWSLMRWSFNLGVQGEHKVHSTAQGFLARLELDINTVPREDMIAPEGLRPLWDELLELGRELAFKGDIA